MPAMNSFHDAVALETYIPTSTQSSVAGPGFESEPVQTKHHELIAVGVVTVFVGLAILGTGIFWIYRKCMLPRRQKPEIEQQAAKD